MTYSNIQKKVMKRVWRIYAMSIIGNTATLVGIMTVVCTAVFAKLVFVSAIIDNTLATEVGQLPSFFMTALTNADIPSLAVFLLLCASGGFFIRSLHRLRSVSVVSSRAMNA
jgi:hypothetical protein